MTNKSMVDEYGTQFWYDKHDHFHRENDLPAIVYSTGIKVWYKHGILHRIGGPSYVDPIDNEEEWMQDGKFHREDGPAVIYPGEGVSDWYLHGKKLDPLEIFLITGQQKG